MNRSCALLALFPVFFSACDKKAGEATAVAEPAAASVAAPSAALPASAAPVAAKPVGLFTDKLPEGLSLIDVSPLPVDVMKKSTSTDTDADKARKANDYEKATQLYVDALKIDPGNHGARFNLARTLILDGKIDSGLGVLDQLRRTESCYQCEGLLLKAAQEKDFKTAADRTEFKQLTEEVGKKLPTFQRAGEMMIKWLDKPSLDNLPPLVDSRTFIILQDSGGYHQFKGAKAFVEYVVDREKEHFPKGRKWGPTLGPPMGMSLDCKNECCDVNTYDPPGGRSVLRQICFAPQGMVATALYKLKVD